MLEADLIRLFNDGLLPKSDWTHQAHLSVGQWHIQHYEVYEAHCILRAKIISLNHFHNTLNDARSGYHETLTLFWLKILAIGWSIIQQSALITMEEFKEKICTKELPLKFYSKEILFSTNARAIFIEPVLMKLDAENVVKLYKENLR